MLREVQREQGQRTSRRYWSYLAAVLNSTSTSLSDRDVRLLKAPYDPLISNVQLLRLFRRGDCAVQNTIPKLPCKCAEERLKIVARMRACIVELFWTLPAPLILANVNNSLKGKWAELACHKKRSLVVQNLEESMKEASCKSYILGGVRRGSAKPARLVLHSAQ
ncbi:hypothetical protein B0H12DRAFT_1309502 [Mycena haematopus]|nr:hypothetical protein B0H12DRAFT_1309502 [Mycena haematopus]